VELVDKVPGIYGVCGIHPLYAGIYIKLKYIHLWVAEYTEQCEQDILTAMKHPKMIAYGEIGLDYHNFEGYNYAGPDLQKQVNLC
jgi:Tat protein secretion system quality control protein TatD with DNase activity